MDLFPTSFFSGTSTQGRGRLGNMTPLFTSAVSTKPLLPKCTLPSFPFQELKCLNLFFPSKSSDHLEPAALEVRFLLSPSTAPWGGHRSILRDSLRPQIQHAYSLLTLSSLRPLKKKKQPPRGRQLRKPPCLLRLQTEQSGRISHSVGASGTELGFTVSLDAPAGGTKR